VKSRVKTGRNIRSTAAAGVAYFMAYHQEPTYAYLTHTPKKTHDAQKNFHPRHPPSNQDREPLFPQPGAHAWHDMAWHDMASPSCPPPASPSASAAAGSTGRSPASGSAAGPICSRSTSSPPPSRRLRRRRRRRASHPRGTSWPPRCWPRPCSAGRSPRTGGVGETGRFVVLRSSPRSARHEIIDVTQGMEKGRREGTSKKGKPFARLLRVPKFHPGRRPVCWGVISACRGTAAAVTRASKSERREQATGAVRCEMFRRASPRQAQGPPRLPSTHSNTATAVAAFRSSAFERSPSTTHTPQAPFPS